LAKHYEMKGIKGDHFRKVTLKDRNRGGLLGMAGILTATSLPLRTSPVGRGKFVVSEILGGRGPPPPPNAGGLPAAGKSKGGLTLRQQLELHRPRPECASCHKRIDPPGFALENFDAIGRWRDKIDGKPVDAAGVLASGEKFSGPSELKKVLLKRKTEFLR